MGFKYPAFLKSPHLSYDVTGVSGDLCVGSKISTAAPSVCMNELYITSCGSCVTHVLICCQCF